MNNLYGLIGLLVIFIFCGFVIFILSGFLGTLYHKTHSNFYFLFRAAGERKYSLNECISSFKFMGSGLSITAVIALTLVICFFKDFELNVFFEFWRSLLVKKITSVN